MPLHFSTKKGDLYVTYEVLFPTSLTEDQKASIQKILGQLLIGYIDFAFSPFFVVLKDVYQAVACERIVTNIWYNLVSLSPAEVLIDLFNNVIKMILILIWLNVDMPLLGRFLD